MKSIDIFPWDDHFNTGIDVIDKQHKRLVDIINRLATRVVYGSDDDQDLNDIFDELIDYTVYHFETEEAIWYKYLPGDLLEKDHKTGHKGFVDEVKYLLTENKQANKTASSLADQALGFLTNWLASHILDIDRHMAYIVLGLQEGLGLAEAKINAEKKMSGSSRILIDIILSIYRTLSTNTLYLMHELKLHKSFEEKVNYQEEYRQLLLDLSASFINIPLNLLESTIQDALAKMAAFVGVERAYIFDYEESSKTFTVKHRWNISETELKKLDDIVEKIIFEFTTSKEKCEYIYVDDSEFLSSQRLISIPLIQDESFHGFIGFDTKKKENFDLDEIELLRLFGRLLVNVNERKNMESKLSHERIMLEAILDNAPLGIWMTTSEGKIKFVNKTFCTSTGITEEEFLNANSYTELLPEEIVPHCLNSDTETLLLESGVHTSTETFPFVDGNDHLLEITKIKVKDDGEIGIIGLAMDITDRHKQQQHLEYMAHYDTLTKLPNRVLLSDRLHQALAQTNRHDTSLAVIYLDLDGFKLINDKYGHDMGDRFLYELSHRIKNMLREGDTIARLGGDEFVIVLLDLKNRDVCEPLLKRLLQAGSEEIVIDNMHMKVSASLGVAFFDSNDNIDADQLLRQADQAMYQAKLAGKNRYHIFDSIKDEKIRTHHESLEEIQKAILDNEFVLYYQPKVNMQSGDILGVEALIRWDHPRSGLLSPGEFLPILEGHELSIDLGYWVLKQALSQIETWKNMGILLGISVNIDAMQLKKHDFVKNLEKLLNEHPLVERGDLSLEVVETSALSDIVHVIQIIHDCEKLGVHFALDDFGTGYSSLTYLKRLPVKELKIDQSFVREMLDNSDDFAILSGVLGLANAFKRNIIAEGVESIDHGVMLLRMGCVIAQGYVIARPMPAEDIVMWMREWEPDIRWKNSFALNPIDVPLIQALMEHKAWIKNTKNYLMRKDMILPVLKHTECNFGRWLYSEGMAQYSKNGLFEAIEDIHSRMHKEVNDIVYRYQTNNLPDIQEAISTIENYSDRLYQAIEDLIDSL